LAFTATFSRIAALVSRPAILSDEALESSWAPRQAHLVVAQDTCRRLARSW